ncbi:hypothetical protein PR202_gb05094 [Eleusine coracana subsp. coracana]|uniref:Uncharacterized protein n=1 Tax=Eleusine coracana subsp. coracana TaxID=191504 RepID=A0AAV5E3R0_ELECO|nr:hypothetical protein PR202_gb05094 [Eleusine coracana subsp. coracana]
MAFAVAPPLPLSSATGGWRRRPWATAPRFVVVACTRDVGPVPRTFGRLREQLLQLHAEADLTQSKANSARTRLVRLTEAAENLKKRAANSVSIGKESEAVDLLVQKKKLTKALESIKERIEVLDKLSAKISEAISLKQNMLIQCALRPETPDGEISDDKIRVFSSKINDGADGTERIFPSKVNDGADGTESSDYRPKSVEQNFLEMRNEAHSNTTGQPEQRELQIAHSFTLLNEHDSANGVTDRSAYDGFLEYIVTQLKSLEYETEQFMSSQLVEEVDNERQIDGKWHRLSDILKLVKETRER